jgi:sugar lactone lactonase YvrE
MLIALLVRRFSEAPMRPGPLGILCCAVATKLLIACTAHGQAVPTYVNQFGGLGTEPGRFEYPDGIAAAPDGSVYVTDQYNYRIEQFGPTGTFIRTWGSSGTGAGQFGLTIGIRVAPNGQVYVADWANNRVQVFTSDGQFVRIFATGTAARDIALAPNGDAYVVTYGNLASRVDVYDSNGAFLREIGGAYMGSGTSLVFASDGTLLVTELSQNQGHIWRIDTTTGNAIEEWSLQSIVGPSYTGPQAIDVGPDGRVYACDYNYGHVAVLSPSGGLIGLFGVTGYGAGQLASAADVAVAPDGTVYVVDLYGNRVVRYSYGPVSTRQVSWGAVKVAHR